ncbi:MAG: SAM-dependent methyltransferase [Myxococcota bacterium]|jgi:SAM-dependent methyltransferase
MRRESPAAHRNAQPIAAALRGVLPERGRVLEVPCGSGVHSALLSTAFPNLHWLPADIDPEALVSTALWLDQGSARLQAPQHLDVTRLPWTLEPVDVVLAVNLIHAAPPEVTFGLVQGAARALAIGGVLILYGPFREFGELCASNVDFEVNYLQQRDPRWGVRDLDDVTTLAAQVGLIRESRIEMPANNLLVVFRRQDVSTASDVG